MEEWQWEILDNQKYLNIIAMVTVAKRISRLLVANRSEIAIRVFRAASELGIRTIAIYHEADRLSLHRYKADEAYTIGEGLGPIEGYLSIAEVIRVALLAKADAIHPGYGFLSENPDFAEACAAAGLILVGPSTDTLRILGNKVTARNLAISCGVPVMPATTPLSSDQEEMKAQARRIGYPAMLKASWGGGGRGMRPIWNEEELINNAGTARRESLAAFGRDEIYLEKLVSRARHIEVQILGDLHGNAVHLFERDCSVQRRHQKVIELAPAPHLTPGLQSQLCESALRIARAVAYRGAGTVEFLVDVETQDYYFIEVNPRIQVEHTVTEVVTGLDIVKAQIRIAEGGHIGVVEETGIPNQSDIRTNGHALQCRITTEDPEANFIPDYGRITAYRGAFGFGIRVDGGTAYSGAVVSPHYDALLEKITAWAPTPREAADRMLRALREYRIRGVATNLSFLEAILDHATFSEGQCTTRFIDNNPDLTKKRRRRDRASRLLNYIGEVTVNGNSDVRGRAAANPSLPIMPSIGSASYTVEGTKQRLARIGPSAFANWMREHKSTLITDTTMRDAHQSLLATRLRTFDMRRIAHAYADGLPELFSIECWGGATFDVAMRFLNEDPWDRLAELREAVPHTLLQMLLRGANGVGYKNYPDNVVRYFVAEAASAGIDIFRIFDCMNWVENMRVSIDAVCETGKIAEGALCYTGDILDPDRSKFSLGYYVNLAKELERAGCHILAIKDMAGLLRPHAAHALVKALKAEVGLPIHVHTHDTSGIAAASILAAIDAGADAVDAAMDAMSGTTSQPCLGSIVQALRHTEKDTGLNPETIRRISSYWDHVRRQYSAFESDLKHGASEVYFHEMPGGQFTNLREQARSLGLERRWHDVAAAYRSANDIFGDIVKVTPSSKVVGDMALLMVSQNLSAADVLDNDVDVAFPESVVEMMRGDLGQPPGGWPVEIQRKVLKREVAISARPGSLLPPIDLEDTRKVAHERCGRALNDREFASYLMYPDVFAAFLATTEKFGPVTSLPTHTYFYGMIPGEEIAVEIERGKTLSIVLLSVGDVEDDGSVKLFFELNGQPRALRVQKLSSKVAKSAPQQADPKNDAHISAPMPGVVSSILVKPGDEIKKGAVILTIEAMKMETIVHAPRECSIDALYVTIGDRVDAKQLLGTLN